MADDTGRCSEGDFARFEVAIPFSTSDENACARELENLADSCDKTLGWRRFAEDLYIGTRGTATPSPTFDGEDFAQVSQALQVLCDWHHGAGRRNPTHTRRRSRRLIRIV